MCLDGTVLTVRPVELTDIDNVARMFARLSRESTYFRFFSPLPRLPRALLLRLTDVDRCRRDALVAFHGDDIIAMASYDEIRGSRDAELAVTVEDAWQGRGIGSRLAGCLAGVAVERGFDEFVARTLPDNRAALAMIRKLAPDARVRFAGGEYEARLLLASIAIDRDEPNAA